MYYSIQRHSNVAQTLQIERVSGVRHQHTTLIHVITIFNYLYFLKLLLLSTCQCRVFVSNVNDSYLTY
jgi:hypothetical protein